MTSRGRTMEQELKEIRIQLAQVQQIVALLEVQALLQALAQQQELNTSEPTEQQVQETKEQQLPPLAPGNQEKQLLRRGGQSPKASRKQVNQDESHAPLAPGNQEKQLSSRGGQSPKASRKQVNQEESHLADSNPSLFLLHDNKEISISSSSYSPDYSSFTHNTTIKCSKKKILFSKEKGFCNYGPGEQHSFILKPSNSSSHPSAMDKVKAASMSPSYEPVKPTTHSLQGSVKQKVKDHDSSSLLDTGNFFIVVSCRCSHTESRLHFKHPIKWQPRSPRDLLLSVSLESVSKPEIPSGSLPTFSPKVVTVQATNLTSDSLHLTLLAPSSKYSGPTPPLPVPNNLGLPRMSSFMSFHEKKEWPIAKNKENGLDQDKVNSEASPSGRPSSLQRSLSLPPAKPIESIMGITPRVVKERAISAADIAAENSSARTHLWLQSIIPLGYVPPQSTTAIRCELLPLTDGIISLDTLHISTKDQDVYYPEQALQIYATSSIGIGIP
ncbi:hypothetical protein L7F22_067330 [Adiantum nelumboides]|nr:hypothetical protein [Adiantum nelumboides]